MGGSKSSGTYISENHIDNPFAFVFVFTNGSEGQNLAKNDQNAYFGPNLAVLGPKPLFFAFFHAFLALLGPLNGLFGPFLTLFNEKKHHF